ncbi:hypothetical protein CERSUDRAFT_112110 [Gelatoporia subvermispora B]|uniref:Septin-type G domain-containing protein n=1 Tax=Ceriporiopsis subvermispora (strain B) TaxID=914234 RepID=M2QRY0_CERS8|nr:hypothetical protein CERSUDRAFT_112110 [Gelatoporia subvermispora B]
MFSFRRKSRKSTDQSGPPFIRSSPSLPELSAQGISWPEGLVDGAFTAQSPDEPRTPQGKPTDARPHPSGPISAMYMSHPPSAFETRKQPPHVRPRRASMRRARTATTFNVMVAGAQGTGKTSLLRLLLDTADVSPTATPEQKAAMEGFLEGTQKRTEAIRAVSVEICESRYDRVLLSVVDTPGLDFQDGHELRLDRQVSSVVRYIDSQYADTLNEESKVVRQSKGDQQIHLCIYMIDPASVMTASTRNAQSTFPPLTRSSATISNRPPELSDSSTTDGSEDDTAEGLSMSPAELRVIQRLSRRVNVLPVVARADSLTDDTLAEIKRVVRRDLQTAELDFGVFESPRLELHGQNEGSKTNGAHASQGSEDSTGNARADNSSDEDERQSRPVIKLRAARHPSARTSRSRTRLDLQEVAAAEDPSAADVTDAESVASVRFSAHVVAKSNLHDLLPFAIITPEQVRRRRPLKSPRAVDERQSVHGTSATPAPPSEDGHSAAPESEHSSPISPATTHSVRNFPYLAGPPADLRGVFVRKFRWGTVDVLSPEHCDFAALRTAVLSTHMKMLKIRTREVLYERFRTEKLLAKRATQRISEDQTRQIMAELGL